MVVDTAKGEEEEEEEEGEKREGGELEEEEEDKSFDLCLKERASKSTNNSQNFARTSTVLRLFFLRVYPITIER